MKPFLKWVGGKTQIIDQVLEEFPRDIDTYHEPFLGGGSVLLAVLSHPDIRVRRVRASDNNPHLVALYKEVQRDPELLHLAVERLFSLYDQSASATEKEAFYYEQRERFRTLPPCIEKCALLIFLNKTCFRGLYREGPNGFNVPYGHYKTTPKPPTLEELRAVQALIKDVEFTACDFKEALEHVKTTGEDFVYADPPYAQETKTSFKEYTKGGFDQELLFKELSKTMFVMSNANVPCVTEFFKGFRILYIKARRAIHSKRPDATTTEVLVVKSRDGCGRGADE
jgi:DNA adenine methylase